MPRPVSCLYFKYLETSSGSSSFNSFSENNSSTEDISLLYLVLIYERISSSFNSGNDGSSVLVSSFDLLSDDSVLVSDKSIFSIGFSLFCSSNCSACSFNKASSTCALDFSSTFPSTAFTLNSI